MCDRGIVTRRKVKSCKLQQAVFARFQGCQCLGRAKQARRQARLVTQAAGAEVWTLDPVVDLLCEEPRNTLPHLRRCLRSHRIDVQSSVSQNLVDAAVHYINEVHGSEVPVSTTMDGAPASTDFLRQGWTNEAP